MPPSGCRLGAVMRSAVTGMSAPGARFNAPGQTRRLDLTRRRVVRPHALVPEFTIELAGLQVGHREVVELVVLGQFIGFVGSSIAGVTARERKLEVERLNERLLTVTKELRKQARANSRPSSTPLPELHATPSRDLVLEALRGGKDALGNGDAKQALAHFSLALDRINDAGNELDCPWRAERKAERGLGAAHELNGDYAHALEHMRKVVDLSKEHRDSAGLSDAFGVIADIYTEMGNYGEAAVWYDRFLASVDNEEEEDMILEENE